MLALPSKPSQLVRTAIKLQILFNTYFVSNLLETKYQLKIVLIHVDVTVCTGTLKVLLPSSSPFLALALSISHTCSQQTTLYTSHVATELFYMTYEHGGESMLRQSLHVRVASILVMYPLPKETNSQKLLFISIPRIYIIFCVHIVNYL